MPTDRQMALKTVPLVSGKHNSITAFK